jgi:hypothetical protein
MPGLKRREKLEIPWAITCKSGDITQALLKSVDGVVGRVLLGYKLQASSCKSF